MPIPAYFTTSPLNGGTPVTANVPPIGGIIYDFIGTNGQRVTAFVNGSAMPAFTSTPGTSQLLDSSNLSQRVLNALGGGIAQLAVRLTVNDGDSAAGNFDFNNAFLKINTVDQVLNTSVMGTYNHDAQGNSTSTDLTPGYPNNELATGWGLITDATILRNIYDSIAATGKVDLYWQQLTLPTALGNVLNFGSGIFADYLSQIIYPSISPDVPVTVSVQPSSDNGLSNTDAITSVTLPVIQGKALPNESLQIFNGTNLVTTVTSDASGNWSYTFTTALPDATYNLLVKAIDGSNNVTAESNTLALTIDTVGLTPSIPDMTPETDTGPANNDDATSNRRPTFTGSAEANSTVRLYNGTELIATLTADGDGNWTYTPDTDLPDGTYRYKTQITDLAGNVSPDSAVLTFIVNSTGVKPIDPTAPGLGGGSGDAGNDNEGVTNNSKPPLEGVVTPGSTIQILVDGQPISGTSTVNPDGTWSFIPDADLPDGTYNVVVRVNTPGVGTIDSPASTLIIDTLPASVQILDFGDTIRDSSVNAISFRFSELVNNVKLSDLELTLNGQPIDLTNAQLSTQDNQTFLLENIPGFTTASGNYQIRIKPSSEITDRAGNPLTIGNSETWETGYTADAFAPQKFKGGKSGAKAFGGGEGNAFRGGRANDLFRAGGGNDRVQGRGGNDNISGGGGKDNLTGGLGKDRVRGQSGSDRIFGRQGNDLLLGGGGNDKILAGGGNDVLVGGTGNDTLTGGRGNDSFRFNSVREGTDTITDFKAGTDVIDLRGIFSDARFDGPNRFAKFRQFVDLVQVGSTVEVRIDADGNGSGTEFTTLAVLNNQSTANITSRNFVVG